MSTPRILSVSFDNLTGIARNALLAHAGYAVSPATSTARAFELLELWQFDLVIIGDTVPQAERRLLFLEINRKFGAPVLLMDSGEPDPLIRAKAHIAANATSEQLMHAVASIVPIKARKPTLERRSVAREPAGC